MERDYNNRGYGGDAGRGANRSRGGGNYPNQRYQHQGVRGPNAADSGRGGGNGRGIGLGPSQTGGRQWVNRAPPQTGRGGGTSSSKQQSDQIEPSALVESTEERGMGDYSAAGGGRGGRRTWSAVVNGQSQPQSELRSLPRSQSVPEETLPSDMESLRVSEPKLPLSLVESKENRLLPIKRPDRGGTLALRTNKLLANHFKVTVKPDDTIMHYDVDFKQCSSPNTQSANKPIWKSDLRVLKDKLFSGDIVGFPEKMTAYDGEKNIFSAVSLPSGNFKVNLSGGEDMKRGSFDLNVKIVNELKLPKPMESGKLPHIPRDILQGMDVVMKENPRRHRISVGKSFCSKEYRPEHDLRRGIAAFTGFQHSLKPTSKGLSLCLDYKVVAFHKKLRVIDFLKERVKDFHGVNDVVRLREEVTSELKRLKVTVSHRITKQNYIIAGLTAQNTHEITFPLYEPEGKDPSREINILDFFREKYNKEITYKDIPCLDLGKGNYVPMEFCTLVEGQRYSKEQLDRDRVASQALKKISMPPPHERKKNICEMMQATDGPCGDVSQNFNITVDKAMTSVLGRVIPPPDLKLGSCNGSLRVRVDDKCQWNLCRKSVVEGKQLKRWALIDFSTALNSRGFILKLRNKSRDLGVLVAEPVVCRYAGMRAISSVASVRKLLENVIEEANGKCEGRLQLLVCVMYKRDVGFTYLKWVSETQIGVLAQCCLSQHANDGKDHFLTNLVLKINAKLGGSNVELIEPLPGLEGEEHVMFVGADVNHPGAFDKTCPSIAAVVATVNWPAVNRYAARACPQEHRKEKIQNFGTICWDLVNTYAQLNKVKPRKIVVFRDGVSDSQFDMVLNEELLDLKRVFKEEDYHPTITVVVAQKRHLTRLFLENERDGVKSANVPPGTVVDKEIVHPSDFDFYLCSHFGSLGTSKLTHYYVLWDEHHFTSDQLQKLIYHMCFTFARCTKSVSVVPPVYYADLVAYRGRLFQEAISSGGTSCASSFAGSLHEELYKLHSVLRDEFFFV